MESNLFFTAQSIHGDRQAKFPNSDYLLPSNLCNSNLRTESMAAADHSYYLPHLNSTHFQITETPHFPNSTHTTHKGKISQEVCSLSEPVLGRKRKETPMSKSKAISPSPSSKTAKVEESSKRGKQKQKGLSENKPPEPPKGYIHVRARRGEATDSHSLAERVRREKISERMKLLQDLVPGCSKVTGKALMLDEIINYVQSLQNQVEFLSMKLASVNFNPDLTLKNGGLPDSMYPPDSSAPTICRQQQGLSLPCNVPDREASLCSVDPNGRPQDGTDMDDLSPGCLLPQDDLQSIVQMAIIQNFTQKRALQG